MLPTLTIPDVIVNVEEIVDLAGHCRELFSDYPTAEAIARRGDGPPPFDPHRSSEYEEEDSYHVLEMNQMPRELVFAIAKALMHHGRDPYDFYFQLQLYEEGDYVLPHRDSLPQALYLLTSSEHDGLIVEDGHGGLVSLTDRAGSMILHDPLAWHWVDPIVRAPRLSMITIPPLWTHEDDLTGSVQHHNSAGSGLEASSKTPRSH